MSKLQKEDVELFYKLFHSLLFYANKKFNVLKNWDLKDDIFKMDIQKTIPLRKKLYSGTEIFDDFVNENPENFSSDELDIVASWKKYKSGEFFLAKHTNDCAVFYEEKEKKAYGVLGLNDSFEEMFQGYAPILVKITLLPFKGKITYEGIFSTYNVHFGGNMRRSLKADVDEAIQKFGIITSLEAPVEEKAVSDEEILRFYMKSRDSMNRYWEEINKLRIKSSELEAVYYQEWAKNSARAIKKNLKRNGIKGHFAVLDEAVIASATSPKKLDENAKAVVPEDKLKWIYKFKL